VYRFDVLEAGYVCDKPNFVHIWEVVKLVFWELHKPLQMHVQDLVIPCGGYLVWRFGLLTSFL